MGEEEEDEFDTMKALENRTLDSKNEIDVLDALDEIKAVNQRHERIDTNKVLSALYAAKDECGYSCFARSRIFRRRGHAPKEKFESLAGSCMPP